MDQQQQQPDNGSFYDDIDEVLGPPPLNLYRYGSSALLVALLILAAIGTFVRYDEGISGMALVEPVGMQEITSPATPATVMAIQVRDGDTVLAGQVLAVLYPMGPATGAPRPDTVRAEVSGICYRQRLLAAGDTLPPGRPLYTISASPGRYRVKIILDPASLPAQNGQDLRLIGRQVSLTLNAAGRPASEQQVGIISEPYPVDSGRHWVMDAVMTGPPPPPPDRVIRAAVFIVTGKKSLLHRLFRF
jgi:hypothetical protein